MGADKNMILLKNSLDTLKLRVSRCPMPKPESVVKIFRGVYKEIKAMWGEFEKAIAEVLAEGKVRVKRNLGPNGCIEISKFVFDCNGRPRTILKFNYHPDEISLYGC